jgi:collagenase-like PrtC family protease
VGGVNIQIVHYLDHVYLEEETSMIHSFTDTFGAKYLTGMVTSVHPYGTFSLIKNNILHQSKIYKNHFENSNF